MSETIPTALEERIRLRSEFSHEAVRFRGAISEAMRAFVLERIDFLLDSYLELQEPLESLIAVQPLDHTLPEQGSL